MDGKKGQEGSGRLIKDCDDLNPNVAKDTMLQRPHASDKLFQPQHDYTQNAADGVQETLQSALLCCRLCRADHSTSESLSIKLYSRVWTLSRTPEPKSIFRLLLFTLCSKPQQQPADRSRHCGIVGVLTLCSQKRFVTCQ